MRHDPQLRPGIHSVLLDRPEPNEEGGLKFSSILDFARRCVRPVLIWEILIVPLVLFYIFAAPPFYRAVSTVILDYRTPVYAGQNPAGEASDLAYIDTQVLLIRSDEIVGELVDKLKLDIDPEFNRLQRPLAEKLLERLPEEWKSRLHIAPPPSLTEEEEGSARRQAAIGALKRVIKVSRSGRSYAGDIEAASRSPDKAANIANTIADLYIDYQSKYRTQFTQREKVSSLARLITPAVAPKEPGGLSELVILAMGVLAGVAAGVLTVAIREAADVTLRSRSQTERASGLRCLAVLRRTPIRHFRLRFWPSTRSKQRFVFAAARPNSPFSQSLIVLASLLRSVRPDKSCRVIGFTSPRRREGRTTIAANFAHLLSVRGERFLLVDADLLHPELGQGFALNVRHQTDPAAPEGMIAPAALAPLKLLLPYFEPGPSFAQRTKWLEGTLERFSAEFDWICIDLPSLALPGDVSDMAGQLDIMIIVAESGKTTPTELRTALRALGDLNSASTAIILNKVTQVHGTT